MSYTRFNRHESMSSETRSEIMAVKKALWMRDDVTIETDTLENMLFGLFDGYLYENLILEAKKLPLDLYIRVEELYFDCMGYPNLEITK